MLTSSATATTDAIGEQMERVRTTAEAESRRTTAALRDAYEDVIGRMSKALDDVSGKFRDATGELRGMAALIQQELETTRAELRRGVLELPQETRENAAQMRKVVTEQIKALNELAALVTRSHRAVDALPPEHDLEAVEDALPVKPAARHGHDRAGPARVAEPPPKGRHPKAEPPAPAPDSPANGSTSRTRSQGEAAPARVPPSAPMAGSSSAKALDSLSGDIARLVDHEAAVELWDRYRRGEKDIFGRHLYTNQGQNTFDEIRRKYRRDSEFKRTVDRYLEEFERLLAEVARNDRDQTLTDTYLISDTGKVYTLLGHASGRFD